MAGNSQAPQVHFIAKKQQFIAQISPEQLMQGGDKRPYSISQLNQNAKRGAITSVYSNGSKGSYNLANAAFANHPVYSMGARTHTNGFNFYPNSKITGSIYGESDVKPKIGGKDFNKVFSNSNGFSGYGSDPYNSVISGSNLPASLTNSGKPTKTKLGAGKVASKEKEQLYDETIKMKILNNQMREDNVKLKTKIKILENELTRKEKTIEDLFSHSTMVTSTGPHSKL